MKNLVPLLVLAAACLANSCSTTQKTTASDSGDHGMKSPTWAISPPDWCGVGIVKYRGNDGLARSSAVSRARDDLERQVRVKLEGAIKDYKAQGQPGGEAFTEEKTTCCSRQLVERPALPGLDIRETHISNGKKRHFFALACATKKSIKVFAREEMELPTKARKAVINDVLDDLASARRSADETDAN